MLEFEPESPRQVEPLMGWTGSSDMRSQVRLRFDSKDEAIAYATRNGIAYQSRGAEAARPAKSCPIPIISVPAASTPWSH